MGSAGEQVGDRIRRARRAKGYRSAKALAEAIGVSENTVWRWERGEIDPSVQSLQAVASACDTSIDWLRTGRAGQRRPELRRFLQSPEGAYYAEHRPDVVERLEQLPTDDLELDQTFYSLLAIAYASHATPAEAVKAARLSRELLRTTSEDEDE